MGYLNRALSLVNFWIPGAWLSENILYGVYSAFDTLFPSLLFTLAVLWFLGTQLCRGGDVPEKYYMTNLTETSRDEMERLVIGRGSSCELEFHISHPQTVLSWEFISTDYDISFGWFRKEIVTRKLKSSKILKEIVSDHVPFLLCTHINFFSLVHHQCACMHETACMYSYWKLFDFRFQLRELIVTLFLKLEHMSAHSLVHVSHVTVMWSSQFMIIHAFIIDILKFDNSYSWARSKEIFYSVKISAPSMRGEPHPPPEQQQDEEAGSPHPHQSTCPAPSSSEDEFQDCIQEVQVTTCTRETEILSCIQDSPQPSPSQLRTSDTYEETLTGASVSAQVWVSHWIMTCLRICTFIILFNIIIIVKLCTCYYLFPSTIHWQWHTAWP